MSDYPADFGHGDDIDLELASSIATQLDAGRPSLRCDGTPEGTKADNDLRASWGMVAVVPYAARVYPSDPNSEPLDATISDLFADLMHLCNAVGLDAMETVEHAHRRYSEEVRGEL